MQTTLSKDRVEHALELHKKSLVIDTHNHVRVDEDIEERLAGGHDCKFYLGYVDTNTEEFWDGPPSVDNFKACYEAEGHFRKAINIFDEVHLEVVGYAVFIPFRSRTIPKSFDEILAMRLDQTLLAQ